MVGAMLRHFHSLRTMTRDNGYIHTLLSEAENERIHLLTFLELKKPSWLLRSFVLVGQGIIFNAYFVLYMLFPKTCHRFVGFLEVGQRDTCREIARGTTRQSHWLCAIAHLIMHLFSSSHNLIIIVLQEEAVKTYTACIKSIDDGELAAWSTLPAPPIGIKYWRLEKDAVMRDLLLAIRADEADHRDVNHAFASSEYRTMRGVEPLTRR